MSADLLNLFSDNNGYYNNNNSLPPSSSPANKSYHSSLSNSYDSLPASDPTVAYPQELTTDVQLEVDGATFMLNRQDFARFATLPWLRLNSSAYKLEGHSPEAFTKCVDYVVFNTLPKGRRKMTTTAKNDLFEMASTLGLTELANHVSSKKQQQQRAAAASVQTSHSIGKSSTSSTNNKKSGCGFGSLFFCSSRAKTSAVEQSYNYKG